jgi:uncharacterized membrane protein
MTSPNAPAGGGSSVTGLAPNMAGALAYLLGPITGILFLVIEKENRFVRFHAMQSTVTCLAMLIVSFALSLLMSMPLLGWIIAIVSPLFSVLCFLLWLWLMWKAFQGDEWEVPVLGAFARTQVAGAP